jgi:DNA-binding transcriptional ArsR family regulator
MLSRTPSLPRNAAPLFAALGDDVRLTLVVRLSKGEPLSITQLAKGLPISRQGVTKHLHVLESAGLIKGGKAGREQRWEVNPASLRYAQQYLDIIARQWSEALLRLKVLVEEK